MRYTRVRVGWLLPCALAIATSLAAATAAVAQTGTITGSVVVEATQRPLSSVQVYVPGTSLGTLTNAQGRYMLVNVPVGEVTVETRLIGYERARVTVNVQAGATVQGDLLLRQEALALDEIIVTGTAGQARRREVGNTLSQITMDDVVEPVTNLDALLQGRAAGVNVTETSGMAGSGSQIRLRGNISVAMSNQPLIYVDGVRARGDGYPRNVNAVGNPLRGGNIASSPLNDINPADIDRIEIIKGAAATTLYGTEAAAGVIQIFTKQGRSGEAVWTAQMDQRLARVLPFGPEGAPYVFIDPWLRTAHGQTYSLSVSGGGEVLRYFVSGSWEDSDAVLPNDWEEKRAIRGNFGFSPARNLNVQWNSSFATSDISNTAAGNNAHGLTLNAFRRDRNYFGNDDFDVINQVLDQEIMTFIDRLNTGVTAMYSPRPNLNNRFTVGYDLSNIEFRQVRPFGFAALPEGAIQNQRWAGATLSMDYVGSVNWNLGQDLATTLSFGGQSATTEETSTTGYGERFAGPGIPTLSSAGTSVAFESRQRVINAGVFLQSLLGFRDRYFLTLGLRVDGNSAFGEALGLQPYPKASLAYVISDEAFWPEALGQVKLRGAYGQAGRAPGAFDAVRTWLPVSWGGAPSFRPGNVGNPNLGPERTAETELGFDAAFLDNRLGVDFTYYHQRTSDALFEVRQVPTLGFLGTQLENVGEIENRGIELSVRGTAIQHRSFTWELGTNISTNRSKVLSLGGAPPFSIGGAGWIYEGHPVPVIKGTLIRNANDIAAPDTAQNHLFGPNLPTHTIGVNTTLHLPWSVLVTARGEYNGGHWMGISASSNALQRNVRWPTCFRAHEIIMDQGGSVDQLTARERLQCVQRNFHAQSFRSPADFFKVRELSLQVPLGAVVPATRSASLILSGRNFYRWTNRDWEIFDPEMAGNEGMNAQVRHVDEHVPAPAIFTASVRASF
jgi:TonB-dependent starch-binding outer membrane protein SusC